MPSNPLSRHGGQRGGAADPSDGVVPHALPEVETHPPGVARPSHLLWALGFCALAVGIALAIGFAVARYPFAIDRHLLLAFRDTADLGRPLGPDWFRKLVIGITRLGDWTTLTIVVLLAVGLLIVKRLLLTAALVLAATLTGSQLSAQAKLFFGRPRPALVDHLVEAGGLSFPSGHATNSAIIYLTMALLISQVTRGRAVRRYVIAMAVLLVGLIGTSRVYLGVHWPSDVLAGWSIGACWALAWWFLGAWLRAVIDRRATGAG